MSGSHWTLAHFQFKEWYKSESEAKLDQLTHHFIYFLYRSGLSLNKWRDNKKFSRYILTEKKNIKIRIMKVNRSCFYFNEVIDREFFFPQEYWNSSGLTLDVPSNKDLHLKVTEVSLAKTSYQPFCSWNFQRSWTKISWLSEADLIPPCFSDSGCPEKYTMIQVKMRTNLPEQNL